MQRGGRSRVQGGWARGGQDRQQTGAPKKFENQFGGNSFEAVHQVSYVDNLQLPKQKPDDIIIQTEGKHVLSEAPSGKSLVHFFPNFLPVEEADRIFAVLSEEVPWKKNQDRYGPQPRLTAWYGAFPYTYSRLTHQPNETLVWGREFDQHHRNEWHPELEDLRKKIEIFLNRNFNSVLCNLYRNNHDHVGWHSDDEPSLKENPFIASVSLGDVRLFEMRKKPPPEENDDFTYSQQVKMHLPHGSLLVMEGSTQADWQHAVPKAYHDKGPRINLTFRTIHEE